MIILLVDDHPMVHEILGAVARSVFADAQLLFAKDLAGALQHARGEPGVDLALLDLGLPDSAEMNALVVFRKACPDTRVIVVSATDDRASILLALELGAVGYVPKSHPPSWISVALQLVAAGGTYIPPEALKFAGDAAAGAEYILTTRQRDVLGLIVRGLANKEIAKRLHIAENTVKQHARAAYAVLRVSSRTQAMNAVARRGMRLD